MPGPGPYGNKKPASKWAGKASALAKTVASKRLEEAFKKRKKIAFRK